MKSTGISKSAQHSRDMARVIVEQDMVTKPKTRLEELKALMEQRRLEKAEQRKKSMSTTIEVPKDLLKKAEDYIVAQGKRSEAERTMDKYKPELKQFMTSNGAKFIHTSKGSLELETRPRPVISSKYMTYDPSDIEDLIPDEFKEIVFERVVNSEILEELVNAGLIPSTVLSHKYTEPKDYLLVKRNLSGNEQ